jgi:DNA polymerase
MPAVGDQKWVDASEFIPSERDVESLREASRCCRGCDLYEAATQTVFGEGRASSSVMLIGEQPGDYEDQVGKPFVGPAGRLLDEVLEEVGIDRDEVYVTNAVKHFKFVPRGKRRIHSKPNAREIRACKPWLSAELEAVQPRVVVCLGATAAQALLGTSFRVTHQRGQALRQTGLAPIVVATVHPASILRAQDDESRQHEREAFVADMRQVRSLLETR